MPLILLGKFTSIVKHHTSNTTNSEIPSNLILQKVSPKVWLPALTVMWGITTMCLGFVKNYAGFMVVRAILGLTEGGLLPGIVGYTITLTQKHFH